MENTLYRRICGQKSRRVINRNLFLFGFPLVFLFAWVYPYFPWHNVGLCAVRRMLGVNCPGCGFIRSIVALLNGNVGESIFLNPMGLVAFVIATFFWIKILFKLDIRISPRVINFVAIIFVVGLFAQWLFGLVINFF